MPGTDDRLVFRLSPLLWVAPIVLAVAGVGQAVVWRHPIFLLAVPGGLWAAGVLSRVRTVLTPDGVEVRQVRTRRLAWGDVVAVAPAPRSGTALVLRDGETVPVHVVWRPPVPATYVTPRSPQGIVDYARAHGHDVELRGHVA